MKKINKYRRLSIVLMSFMLSAIMLTPIFVIDSNRIINSKSLFQTQSLFQNNSKAVSTNLKVLNSGDFIDNETQNNSIKDVYSRKPSQIQDTEIRSIIEIINVNIPPYGIIGSPTFTNLSRHPMNSTLTNDDPLECFAGVDASLLTPNYLDQNGLLAFKAAMNEGNVQIVEYYLISGFNSRIISTTLPGNVYQYSVADLTDSMLESFITFPAATQPNGYVLPNKKSLTTNSRVQDPSKGTISFNLDLTYNVPNVTFLVNEDPATTTIAQYNIETKFQTKLSYFGFQPSGNLSTKKLYELIGFVLGISIALVLIITITAIIIKKIKFKKAL